MRTLKKLLTENLGLKFLSLAFAAILWFLVTNLNDPAVPVTFSNVPVNIRNTSLITSQGKVYEVLDGTDVISSVRIVAPRSIADSFTKENVVATADMTNLSSLDTLTINLTTNKYASQVESITGSIDTVRLSIEDSKTKTLILNAETTGTLPEGYIISQITTEQNVLRITGPESAVNRVARAEVSVDVSGFTTNIDTDADIVLYDGEGDVVNDSSIGKNIDAVRVGVTILQTKRVPISVTVTGTPEEGYAFTGDVEVTPDTVLLAGRESALRNIELLTLTDEAFDVTGRREDLMVSVNIRSMLPSGVSLGDSAFGGQVSVRIAVGEAVTKKLFLPEERIELKNVPAGMKANIQTEDYDEDGQADGTVEILLKGLQEDLDGVSAQQLSAVADLTELTKRLGVEQPEPGAYRVSLALKLPADVAQAGEARALVYLDREATEEE